MKMNFYSHGNKTHFHKKGLVLEVTVIRNQKWPFYSLVQRDSERKMRDVFNRWVKCISSRERQHP